MLNICKSHPKILASNRLGYPSAQLGAAGVGLEPTTIEFGMGFGQGIRPHQSPLSLRGSYSLSLVRLTLEAFDTCEDFATVSTRCP